MENTLRLYRLGPYVISEDDDGELWWHLDGGPEVGMLSGRAKPDGDTLRLRSWSVRSESDDFHVQRLSAQPWTRTRYIEAHGVRREHLEPELYLN